MKLRPPRAPLHEQGGAVRICLVLDNPLRDLDGLVILARALVRRGFEAIIVPMYSQQFDVIAMNADIVLVNYTRANNLDVLRNYARRGIKIGVLDTEGTGGKTAEEFARLVACGQAEDLIDLYCVWGTDQYRALLPMFGSRLKLTGCPRYDYCAPQWRPALKAPHTPPGYILVNTNFPTVNPRFSRGSQSELQTMQRAGFAADFAETYIADAKRGLRGMIKLVQDLATRFPNERFILRPHPFEGTQPYRVLEDLPNVDLRQEGTSLEWLAHAKFLIHSNCSTAVEAAMLGRVPVSPKWLDTPTLNVPGPSALSLQASNEAELIDIVRQIVEGATLQSPQAARAAAAIHSKYHEIDGHASDRVADAVLGLAGLPSRPGRTPVASLRGLCVRALQGLLGPDKWFALGNKISPAKGDKRTAKSISIKAVSDTLDRLSKVDGEGGIFAEIVGRGHPWVKTPRMISGGSIALRREV